jgi:hypothetical protein
MSEQGETGETGDRGERGPLGDTGRTGFTGRTGEAGTIGPIGIMGERGPVGDHGQHGDKGAHGMQGETGPRGQKGRSVTFWQMLAVFVVVIAVFVGLSYRTEIQQHQIQAAQKVAEANTANIIRTRIDSCYAGIAYVQKQNAQYDALIAIEKSLASDPTSTELGTRIAKARIRAYTNFKTAIPPNACPPR